MVECLGAWSIHPPEAASVTPSDRYLSRLVLLGRRPCRLSRHAALPEEQDFSGKTLEEALAWCLV